MVNKVWFLNNIIKFSADLALGLPRVLALLPSARVVGGLGSSLGNTPTFALPKGTLQSAGCPDTSFPSVVSLVCALFQLLVGFCSGSLLHLFVDGDDLHSADAKPFSVAKKSKCA